MRGDSGLADSVIATESVSEVSPIEQLSRRPLERGSSEPLISTADALRPGCRAVMETHRYWIEEPDEYRPYPDATTQRAGKIETKMTRT